MAIRTLAKLAVAGLSALALLQFVMAGHLLQPLIAEIQVPPRVGQILQKDCYSCHSNERRLAWFDEITPPYSLVRHDILAARERLQLLLDWDQSQLRYKEPRSLRVQNMIQLGAMPLRQFTALHPDSNVNSWRS